MTPSDSDRLAILENAVAALNRRTGAGGFEGRNGIAIHSSGGNVIIDGKALAAALSLPQPPAVGDYVIMARAGVVFWARVEEFTCPA